MTGYIFDEFELPEAFMNRLICHVLIDHLQDSGLTEARETLAEMVSFYDNPPPTYRQLPHGPQVTVEMGPPIIRPVYPVVPDTDRTYTMEQMAQAWQAIGRQVSEDDDVPLSVDPDDYPLF
jgi:hypothetical protein